MNTVERTQGQKSLTESFLKYTNNHKNLVLAGVFVFLFVGFFAFTALQANSAEAAITYVGGRGAGTTNANSTLNVALNSGLTGGSGSAVAAGDLVIVTVSVGTQARQPNIAVSGYTALTAQRTTATTYDTNVQTSYKFMPSTPDTTVTIPASGNNADGRAYTIHVFRGVDPTTPLDGVAAAYATGSGTSNRPDPASITPASSGAWIYFGGGGAAATGAAYTAAYQSGFLTFNGADTSDGSAGAGYYSSWVSGAYDGAAYGGGSANAANSWGSTTLVLRPIAPAIISGTVYANDESTAYTTSTAMKLSVNGGTALSANSTGGTGAFSFSVDSPTAGDVITIWLDTGGAGGVQGTLVFKYGSSCTGNPNCTGLTVVRDQIRIHSFNGTSVTNTNLQACDNDSGTGCSDSDIGFTSNSGVLNATWATNELAVALSTTFSPGNDVTVQKLQFSGTYIGTGTTTLTGSGTNNSCFTSDVRPLCGSGTFTAGTTTAYTGSSATTITTATYQNLTISPSANGVTHTIDSGPLSISGNLTLGNGTNTGVIIDFTAYNNNVTTTGASSVVTISANTTLQAGSGTWTLSGTGLPFVVFGTFTANTSTFIYTNATSANITGVSYYNLTMTPSSGTPTYTAAPGITFSYKPAGTQIESTVYDAVNGTVYAATFNDALIFRCAISSGCDAPGDWATSFDASGNRINDFAIDTANNVLYAAGDGIVFRCALSTSCDAGGDWATAYDPADATSYQITYDDFNGALIVSVGTTGIYTRCLVSTACDAGGDWAAQVDPTTDQSIIETAIDTTNNVLYAVTFATTGTIIRCALSTACDAFGDWTTSYDPTEASLNSITFDSANGVLYVGTNGTGLIYRCAVSTSCDAAGDWTTSYDSTETSINSLVYSSTNAKIYATTSPSGLIFSCAVSTSCDAAGDWSTVVDINEGQVYELVDAGANGLFFGTGSTGNMYKMTEGMNVSNNFTISANATFNASSSTITIGGNFTNSGTFSAGTSTVIFNGGSPTTITGSNTFNNFTVTTAGKNIDFTAGTTTTINGLLTVTGGSGNNVIFDSTAASVWNITHNGTESITYLTVNWGACVSSTTITMGTGSTKDGNSGTCWEPPASPITLSGTVYMSDAVTADTSGQTLFASIGGGTSVSTAANGSGVFTFSNFGPPSAGNIITIWIDGGSVFGTAVIKYGTSCTGNPDCTGINLVRNAVTIYGKNATNVTNTDLAVCDEDDGGFGCGTTNIGYNVDNSTSVLTVADGFALDIKGSTTFAPGFAVTTSPSADGTDSNRDGDIGIESGSNITMGTNALSVGGDFGSLGTFTKSATQTTTFTATATGHTIHNNYSNWENVVLNGSGGGWSFGSSAADLTIDGDLTVTAGTLSGTLPTNVKGGDLTGAGTINLTGGTLTLSGTGNLNNGAAWTFYNLTLGDGSTSGTTTKTGMTGLFRIDNVFTIATNHTFNGGSAAYAVYLYAASGTPMVRNGTFTANGSAIFFGAGTNATVNLPAAAMTGANAFGNLTIWTGTTATAQAAITANDVLSMRGTLNMGTNNLIVGNTSTLIGGESLISAIGATGITQNANNSTTLLTPNGTTACLAIYGSCATNNGSGTWAFGDLILGDGSATGTFSFGPGSSVSFTSDDLTVTTGATLTGPQNFTASGAVTGNGTINMTAGTFTHSTTTSQNFGGDTAWSFNNLTTSGASGTTAATGTGSVTVAGNLNNGASHTLNAGSKTWIMTSGTTPFTNSGSFTPSTSTFSYRGAGVSVGGSGTFYNLELAPTTGTQTYASGGAGLQINNDLTLGGAGNAELDMSLSSDSFNVDGSVTVGVGDILSLDTGTTNYVGGSWTNSGTFNNANSTIVFDSTTIGRTISVGTGSFYNLTFNGVGGEWTLQDNPTISNVLTITNGNLVASSRTITLAAAGTPFVKSGGTFTQGTSTVNYDGGGNTNILALNGASTTDAYYNLSIKTTNQLFPYNYTLAGNTTVNNNVVVGGGTCDGSSTLALGIYTLTLKGSGTPLSFTNCGLLSADDGTVIYNSGSGTTALSNVDLTGTRDLYNLQINGSGTFNIGTNIDISTVGSFAIATGSTLAGSTNNISVGTSATGDGAINLTGGTFTMAGTGNFGSLSNWNFNNLTIGTAGSVTAVDSGGINVAGVLTIDGKDAILNAGSKVWTLSGTGTPFLTNDGFSADTSTFNYTGAGATNISAWTYYNLGVLPGANSATHTFGSGAYTIGGNLVLGNGTNTGVVIDGTLITTLDINGSGTSFDLKANTTFTAPTAMSVFGSWSDLGTFTHSSGTVTFDSTSTGRTITSTGSSFNNITFSGSGGGWSPSDAMVLAGDLTVTAGTLSGTQNVTVNGGDVLGGLSGDINMTNGTFLIDGTGSFNNLIAWDFYNLTLGDGTGTATTTSGNNGAINVSGVLTIAANQTLAAGSKVWTLSGNGTSMVRTGTFTSGSSQFYFTGSGAVSLPAADMTGTNAFYRVVLNGSGPYTAQNHITTTSNMFVNGGRSLAMGNFNLTVGSATQLGTLQVGTSASLTQGVTATTTLLGPNGNAFSCIGSTSSECAGDAGTITLGDLIIGDGSNAITTTLGGTTSTLSADTITVAAGSTFNAGTDSTINLTGNGASVLTGAGTLNVQTSTINFNSTDTTGTTIPARTYYNLGMNRASNTFTAAGAINVNNNLTITAGTFIAPAGNLTIVNDFTNNGTFTHNSGTVLITPASEDTVVIGGSSNTTFHNLTNTTPKTRIQFANGRTYAINGAMTMTGANGRPVWLQSTTPGVQWLIDINGSTVLSHVNVQDSGCSSSLDIVPGVKVFNQGNNGPCWKFIVRGPGIVYEAPGTGAAGGGCNNCSGNTGGGSSGGGAGSGGAGQGGGSSNSGARSAGTLANDQAVGVLSWDTPLNAGSSNNVYSFISSFNGTTEQTYYLKATNFGFSIPSTATINGVELVIEKHKSPIGTVTDNIVRLVKSGTVSGNNKASGVTWQNTTDQSVTYGNSSDLWGLTLTPSDVNSSNFGMVISANLTSDIDNGGIGRIDHITLTVYYTTTPTSGGGGGGDGGGSP